MRATGQILCICQLALLGCGAPAIIDASASIGSLRDCEAVQLSMAATASGYQVMGCGPSGVYACSGGTCTESSSGDADESWAAEASDALAAITSEALACNHGTAVTVQVRLDADGELQSMAVETALTGDERACVGRLILGRVDFPASESERLVSHRFRDREPSVQQDPLVDSSAAVAMPEPSPDGTQVDEMQADETQADGTQADDAEEDSGPGGAGLEGL